VHPQEDRLWTVGLREMREHGVGRLFRGAFGSIAGEPVVVDVESAREPEAPRQGERRDECRGAIAGLLQPFGRHRQRDRKVARVLVDAVPGRIEAGHHRAVRRQRLRNRRVRLPEAQPSRGNRVERRRLDARGVRTDRVGARRVERHEQDRRPQRHRGTCARRCWSRTVARAEECEYAGDREGRPAGRTPIHFSFLMNWRARS
jgi:hypothetical protein